MFRIGSVTMEVSGTEESSRILIVEDSPTQLEELKYILQKKNYNIDTATNGKDAIKYLSGNIPEMIISDIMMPEMDGYELCRIIKSDESFKKIPVILLTTLSSPDDVLKGLDCGADNFITKPYDE